MNKRYTLQGCLQQIAVWILILVFTMQPVFAATEVVVDASQGKNPGIEMAQNEKVNIVQIVTPDASGLSHNQYINFQVGSEGLIFNNGTGLVHTQLAGYITGNTNLTGGSAKIILNEITGKLPTNLNGYMEVAGNKAAVIIANPNGIVGNGFGFINANRAVLTTGVPVFGGTNSLEAFRVSGGQIAIGGTGLDGREVDKVDLMARAVQVNAGIWGKEVQVITGANQVNYKDNTVVPIAPDLKEEKPVLAVDVSALGGMYANKIKLVGTEAGVGINSAGSLQASSDIYLGANGKITLADNENKTAKTNAQGNVTIEAQELENGQMLYAGKDNNLHITNTTHNTALIGAGENVKIDSAASLINTGAIKAGLTEAGTQTATGNISIKSRAIENGANASLTAGNSLTTAGESIENSGTVLTGGTMNLQEVKVNNNGQIEANALAFTADTELKNQGKLRSLGTQDWNLTLQGTLDNSGGTIETNSKNLQIQAAALNNTNGRIVHTGSAEKLEIGAIHNQQGSITTLGSIGVKVKSLENTEGTVYSGADLKIEATEHLGTVASTVLTTSDTGIQAKGKVSLLSDGDIQLEGNTQAETGDILVVAKGTLKNQGLVKGKNVTLQGGKIENSGKAFGDSLQVTADQITNNGQASDLTSAGTVTLTATGALNNQGGIHAGTKAQIQAASVTNNGTIFSNTLDMTADQLQNSGKTAAIATTGDMKLQVKEKLINQDEATIYSMGNLQIAGAANADPAVEPEKTGSLLNESAVIETDGDLQLQAKEITNKKKVFKTEAKVVSVTSSSKSEAISTAPPPPRAGYNLSCVSGGYYKYTKKGENGSGSYVYEKSLLPESKTRGRFIGRKTYVASTATTTVTTTENVTTEDSRQAEIKAGGMGAINADSLINDMGLVTAGKDLTLTVANVNNISVGKIRTELTNTQTKYTTHYFRKEYSYGGRDSTKTEPMQSYYREESTVTQDQKVTELPAYTGIISGGQKVSIITDTLNNETLKPAGSPVGGVASTVLKDLQTPLQQTPKEALPEIVLPQGGLYIVNKQPESKYLVETNPKFANFQTFVSSDYLLKDKLHLKPEEIDKRLGDGFYEQKLIGEQLENLTGKQYLGGYTNANLEITALMDQAYAQRESLHLAVGMELTPEQIAGLKQDIVWMVTKKVDGKEVLVPKVYLADTTQKLNLSDTGALILGDSVDIIAKNSVNNTGSIRGEKQLSITAGDILNRGGTIKATDLKLTAETGDITNQSGKIAANTLALEAKNGSIKNETLTGTQSTTYQDRVGRMTQSKTILSQLGSIEATTDLSLKAGKDIHIQGGTLKAGNAMSLEAEKVELDTIEQRKTMQMREARGNNTIQAESVHNIGSELVSGNTISIVGKNAEIRGSQVNAEKSVQIKVSDNLHLTEATDQSSLAISGRNAETVERVLHDINPDGAADFLSRKSSYRNSIFGHNTNYTYDQTAAQGSTLSAAGDISLTAGKDLTLQAAKVESKKADVTLDGGTVNITSGKSSVKTYFAESVGSNYHRETKKDETVNGSEIQAGNTLKIHATQDDANIKGSYLAAGTQKNSKETTAAAPAGGEIQVTANKNINIVQENEVHEQLVETRRKRSGTFSSSVTETRDYSRDDQAQGSLLSADKISLAAGNQITAKTDGNVKVISSSAIATEDLSVQATGDITVEAGQNKHAEEHYSHTKKSGLFSGGGLGFTIGSQSQTDKLNVKDEEQSKSTLASLQGNVTLTAGESAAVKASDVIAKKDITITAKDVDIESADNTYTSQEKHEFKQTGLTVSLGGEAIKAAQSIAAPLQRSAEVKDDRLKALYAYKSVEAMKDAKADGGLAKMGRISKNDLSLSVSFGSKSEESQSNSTSKLAQGSHVDADGNVAIQATQGNIDVKGSDITGKNIALDAKKNVNITAGENSNKTTSESHNSDAGFGVSFSTAGLTGVELHSNQQSDAVKENTTTYKASTVTAKDTLDLHSGEDTNILGSKASGDKVKVKVEGNLNLESLQDKDTYEEKSDSSGFGISSNIKHPEAGKTGGNILDKPNYSGSVSKGNIDSDYNSVTKQAEIHAGQGGFAIEVGKNTDLKGAVISSDATADKNKISTGTLTYSDIENKAEYSADSTGVNYDSKKYDKTDKNYKNQGFTPVANMPVSGDADSTTKSAVSPGKIEIRSNPNQDISGLSRDTTNSLNALGKIFDKATVQEKQELANMFGEVAFNAIGDLGLKEDDPNKVALKSIVGGIMSQIGGGSFTSGATSAGFNQLIMKELSKIKNPAMLQWASLIIGATVSKLTGGDALTGGSITLSDIRNNFEDHFREKFSFWLDNRGYIEVTLAVAKQDSALIAVEGQNIDVTDLSVVEQLFNYVCDSGKASFEGQEFVRVQIKQNGYVVNYDINTRDAQRYGFDRLEVNPAGQEQDGFVLMLAGTEIVLGKVAAEVAGDFVIQAGIGSTGRTIANTLKEQLAMKEVMSNPLYEATELPIKMTDSRWLAEDGWVKMSNNINGVEIHFVYNKITQIFDDFKFK